MKERAQYTYPLELTHDITKGKYKPIILWLLKDKTFGFLELLRNISGGISQKVLTEQLKELVYFGFVIKEESEGYPLKVEYILSKRGYKMLGAIQIMQEIGIDIMREDGREDFLKEKGLL